MIGRNLLDYFKHDAKLQSFDNLEILLKKVINGSSVFAKIVDADPNNRAYTMEGNLSNYGDEVLIIKYPAYPDDEEYEKKFNLLLRRIAPNAFIDVSNIGDSKNELLVLRGRSPMALRSFELVKGKLRKSYDNAFLNIANETVTNLTLHTENGRESYSKLIPFTDDEKYDEFLKLYNEEYLFSLLTAYSIGVVEKINDRYYFRYDLQRDLSGREPLSEKGEKFYQIKSTLFSHDVGSIANSKKLKDRIVYKILESIDLYLNTRDMKKVENREKIIDKIYNQILPGILKLDYENDITDKEFSLIKKAADKAIERLKMIN